MSLTLATVSSLSPLQVTTDGSSTAINALNVGGQALAVGTRVLTDTVDRVSGGQLAILAVYVTADSWHLVGGAGEPAFQNSWVNFAALGYLVAQFSRDPLGVVAIEGMVKSGTVSSTGTGVMFTLPVGYRPRGNLTFIQQANAGSLRVDVHTDGTVIAWSLSTGADNSFASLSGIKFKAA